MPYGWEQLPDGTRLDHRLRVIFREGVEEAGLRRSPFTRWGMEEFYAWLSEPAAAGRAFGINRLCLLVRDAQPQLRDAYPDLDLEADAYGLIEWLHKHGVREGTLPAAVVPPTSARPGSRRNAAAVRAAPLSASTSPATSPPRSASARRRAWSSPRSTPRRFRCSR